MTPDYYAEDDLLGRLLHYPHRIEDLGIEAEDFAWADNRRLFVFLRDYKQHEPAVIAFLAGQALADWAQQLAESTPLTETGMEARVSVVKRMRRVSEYRRSVSRIVATVPRSKAIGVGLYK